MAYVEMTNAERDAIERRIAGLPIGAELRVRFTARGSRIARVTRIRPDGARFVETYSPKRDAWSKPRRLTADDLKFG